MINWLKSRRKLTDKIRRLESRVTLQDDEIGCLKLQRDAALDTIAKLQTSAQVDIAANKSVIESLRKQ